MKILIEKEIPFTTSNIYTIIEQWLSENEIYPSVLPHKLSIDLAKRIYNKIEEQLNKEINKD